MEPLEKSENPSLELMTECSKDHREIDYNFCYKLLTECLEINLLRELIPYTKESILHVWWLNGHLELIEDLLSKQPRIAKLKDLASNTAFHSLWKNTTSSDSELITIFQYLNQYQINLTWKNEDGNTGIDLLIKRIRDKNPYDGNLQSIRLLYWNVLDSIPMNYYLKVKEMKNFVTKERILDSELSDMSSMASKSFSQSGQKKNIN